MNLQTSLGISFNERRLLFADELLFGGHGQIYASGAGTYIPTSSEYVLYKIHFLSDSVVQEATFRDATTNNTSIYIGDDPLVDGASFKANSFWVAPLTEIILVSGSAIIYQYKKFLPEELMCGIPVYIPVLEDSGYEYAYLSDLSQAFLDDSVPLQIISP